MRFTGRLGVKTTQTTHPLPESILEHARGLKIDSGILSDYNLITRGQKMTAKVPPLIFCRGGGGKKGNIRLAKKAIRLGYLYGSRSDDSSFGLRCRGLVDINWKKYNWNRHVDYVKEHEPLLAAVPDVTDRDMIARTIERYEELVEHCGNVMVIPKLHGLIKHLPLDMVIGVSVPSKYAGFLPNISELKGHKVHLLGGSPTKQIQLSQKYRRSGITVFSADGNSMCRAAIFGKHWSSEKFKWIHRTGLDYNQLAEISLKEWKISWERTWNPEVCKWPLFQNSGKPPRKDG